MKKKHIYILLIIALILSTTIFYMIKKENETKAEAERNTLHFYTGKENQDKSFSFTLKDISQKNLDYWYKLNANETLWKALQTSPQGSTIGLIKLTKGLENKNGTQTFFTLQVKQDKDDVYLSNEKEYYTMKYKDYMELLK